MKKISYILITALLFCLSLTACGGNTAQTAYTKEFSYLPAYSSEMKLVSTTPPNKLGFAIANYTIKNAKNTDVFQNYENILKKNGWNITHEQKPNNFIAKKGTHQASVIISPYNKDVKILIMSK
jgi:hypothetical protein